MSIFDRLTGRTPQPADATPGTAARPASAGSPSAGPDTQAIDRYRYLLRTAPPEDLERAHAEAFAQLTPDQRAAVLRELGAAVPPSERATSDDPASLARMATRAELRQPGTMERVFTGPSMGGMFLSTLAGAFIGTAIAQSLFGGYGDQSDQSESGDQTADADQGDGDGGEGGDFGGGDTGGGDFGGDFGGGDFGGF